MSRQERGHILPDTLISATGYEVHLPFLDESLSPLRGRWLELFHQVAKSGVPGLYFLGFFNVSGGGNIRMMDDQAQRVAALETKKTRVSTSLPIIWSDHIIARH